MAMVTAMAMSRIAMAASAAGSGKSSFSRSVTARSGRRGGRLRPGTLAKAVIGVGLGVYLRWWGVPPSTINAEVEVNPFLAARADPHHPRVRISLAMVY